MRRRRTIVRRCRMSFRYRGLVIVETELLRHFGLAFWSMLQVLSPDSHSKSAAVTSVDDGAVDVGRLHRQSTDRAHAKMIRGSAHQASIRKARRRRSTPYFSVAGRRRDLHVKEVFTVHLLRRRHNTRPDVNADCAACNWEQRSAVKAKRTGADYG